MGIIIGFFQNMLFKQPKKLSYLVVIGGIFFIFGQMAVGPGPLSIAPNLIVVLGVFVIFKVSTYFAPDVMRQRVRA